MANLVALVSPTTTSRDKRGKRSQFDRKGMDVSTGRGQQWLGLAKRVLSGRGEGIRRREKYGERSLIWFALVGLAVASREKRKKRSGRQERREDRNGKDVSSGRGQHWLGLAGDSRVGRGE